MAVKLYDLVCEHCHQPFQAPKKRRCCTRSHSAQLMLEARGDHPWKPEELALLEELSGHQPFPAIVSAVQRLDRKMGWHVRTHEAVKIKLGRMGLTRKCVYDNFTRQELARTLNIPYDRVESWTQKHGLPYSKVSRNQGRIKLIDFQKWAKQNPQCLAAIEFSRLLFVLNDERLAQQCSEMPLPTIGRPQRVRNLHTGQEYPSFRQAALASYVTKHCIPAAIERGGRSAGYAWEVLDER